MVDRDVDEEFAVFAVNRVDEFEELFQRSRGLVEFGEFGIDRGEVERSVGTAEASHASVYGRSGVDGQQMQDAALHAVEDVIKFADQRAERSGRGDDGVVLVVEFIFRHCAERTDRAVGGSECFVFTELADECAVDGIGAAVGRGGDVDMDVLSVGPQFCGGIGGNEISFCLEVSGFDECEADGEFAVSEIGHGNVVPVLSGRGETAVDDGDRFGAANGGVAEVGAEKCASRASGFERDLKDVAGIEQPMDSGGGSLNWCHDFIPVQRISISMGRLCAETDWRSSSPFTAYRPGFSMVRRKSSGTSTSTALFGASSSGYRGTEFFSMTRSEIFHCSFGISFAEPRTGHGA